MAKRKPSNRTLHEVYPEANTPYLLARELHISYRTAEKILDGKGIARAVALRIKDRVEKLHGVTIDEGELILGVTK